MDHYVVRNVGYGLGGMEVYVVENERGERQHDMEGRILLTHADALALARELDLMASEATLVERSKAHSTGTHVRMLLDDKRRRGELGRWLTECEEHDVTAAWRTRFAARTSMARPERWCAPCARGLTGAAVAALMRR